MQESNRNLSKEKLLNTLTEHLKQNVLQFKKKFYLQKVGIPQGSILSNLLCSFYYGHMENNILFPFIKRISDSEKRRLSTGNYCLDSPNTADSFEDPSSVSPKYMLLRFIDDFLFISNSEKLAQAFFTRLHRGFRAYNCNMNEDKFGLNFDVGQRSNHQSKRFYVGEYGASFMRWCGLLINSCTLEVQADYTRYCYFKSSLVTYTFIVELLLSVLKYTD